MPSWPLLATVGVVTSLGIIRVPAADPYRKLSWNILGEIRSNLRVMKADRDLWRANWGNTAFFFVASLVQINLALYAQKVFLPLPTEQAWLQAALSLGLGSLLAGRLSRDRIEYGLIAPGTARMALAGLAGVFVTWTRPRAVPDMLARWRKPPESRWIRPMQKSEAHCRPHTGQGDRISPLRLRCAGILLVLERKMALWPGLICPCTTPIAADLATMKNPCRLAAWLLATLLPAAAAPGPKFNAPAKQAAGIAPKYTAESPLPKGWPEPGPFNQVARKSYPAYRAAFTATASPNGGFWRLFKHIKSHDIPMSAPVEMKLDATQPLAVRMEEMAFIYRSNTTGRAGADGAQVVVRDVPACQALSYAWQGGRDQAAAARAALDAALASQHLAASGYRLLGYNSPFVPAAKQTHELQAVLR